MTAQPLSSALAKVRKLLPVRIVGGFEDTPVALVDRTGRTFCIIPGGHGDAMARAELIRDAMNGMM